MTSLLVLAVAAVFLGMGIVALLRPARVLGLFGVTVVTNDGRNEVRAVCSGYGPAMGVLLACSPVTPLLRPGILTCVAVAMLGMAAGHLVSFRIDGRAGFYPRLFLGIEVATGAILLGTVTAGWAATDHPAASAPGAHAYGARRRQPPVALVRLTHDAACVGLLTNAGSRCGSIVT